MARKKEDMRKMGRYSRDKGKRFERFIANKLKERGFNARRGQQFKGTTDSHDVECQELPMMNIEAKAVERLNIEVAMEQARADTEVGNIPIVIHKKVHKRPLVTMELEHWIDLVQWARNEVDSLNNLDMRVENETRQTIKEAEEDELIEFL